MIWTIVDGRRVDVYYRVIMVCSGCADAGNIKCLSAAWDMRKLVSTRMMKSSPLAAGEKWTPLDDPRCLVQ